MSSRSSSGGDDMWGTLILLVLLGVGYALWWLHKLIAWAILLVFRDAFVYLFGDSLNDEESENAAVVWWLVFVPLMIFGASSFMVYAQLSRPDRYLPSIITIPLAASAGGLVVYHYYRLFAAKAPKHRSWARFMAAAIRLKTELKLAYIEERFRLKLWWS